MLYAFCLSRQQAMHQHVLMIFLHLPDPLSSFIVIFIIVLSAFAHVLYADLVFYG